VHEDLQQQVTQLLPERIPATLLDGLERLVRLLEKVGAQAAVALGAIPGAATRRAQRLDGLVEQAQLLRRLLTHL